jgi:lipopolysaccharide assembly protein A
MTTQPQQNNQDITASVPAGPGTPAGADAAPVPPAAAPPELPQHKIRRTRISGIWVGVACFALVLLLLLIFILQNSHTVEVSYFGAHGHLPLGVALLLAAIAGVLLIGLPSAARIVQLRATARRHRKADTAHVPADQPAVPGDSQASRP